MRLVSLRVRNFRCFKEEVHIDFDDITALVGRNDAGKSSLFDALDIFFNDIMPDKNDATKDGDLKDLTIICEFDNLPSKVIIDEDYPTNLKEEYLLNSAGRLEIHKTYSGNLTTPKCTSIAAFAVHPSTKDVVDLLQLKNQKLKERAKQLATDLNGVDQKINAQLRSRIREQVGKLNLKPLLVPLNEENGKDIWLGLKKYIPAFALFKSDRPSTDQDPEAQDPLKAAIKEAIKTKEREIGEITQFVENEVKKIAAATLKKIKEMDPNLASQLNPQFAPPKWDSLFKASITGESDIPINKRGSGVRRLILLNFFRAKAEQQAKEAGHNTIIFGIEEPETCQHPNNQRMLLRALIELSETSQVIISTHTPMLARGLSDKNIRYINIGSNNKREILIGGDVTNQLFSKELGVLPDNNVKLFIGVEGTHDISFLQNMSRALLADGLDIPNLMQLEINGEVIFFPCGGSNLLLWTSRLEHLNRHEFHLCDRDNPPPKEPKYKKHIDEVNKRTGCKGYITDKKEIENYLHKDAIMYAYKENGITINLTNNFSDFDDVPQEIARLIHNASGSQNDWDNLDDETKKDKISNSKRVLNIVVAKYMNQKLLKEMDPKDEVLSWLKEIKSILAK